MTTTFWFSLSGFVVMTPVAFAVGNVQWPTTVTKWLLLFSTGVVGYVGQLLMCRSLQLEAAGPATMMRCVHGMCCVCVCACGVCACVFVSGSPRSFAHVTFECTLVCRQIPRCRVCLLVPNYCGTPRRGLAIACRSEFSDFGSRHHHSLSVAEAARRSGGS